MILDVEQARELGEALLDACENSSRTGDSQSVAFIDERHAVALPLDIHGSMKRVQYVVQVMV